MSMPADGPVAGHELAVIEGLRRWRGTFVVLVLLSAVLAAAGFGIERATAARAERSAQVLRAVSAAQRSIWLHERAVRDVGLGVTGADAASAAATRSAASARIEALRTLTAGDTVLHARLDSLDAAFERWTQVYAAPTLASGAFTREIAIAGTAAFDEVSRQFESLLELESAVGLSLVRAQILAAWGTFLVLLTALLIIGATFRRVADELRHEAWRTAQQTARLQEQVAENQRQSAVLEEQAAQLEETAAELRARVEEQQDTNRLLEETATFLDSAVESAPFGIAFYGRDLRFLRVNPTLAAMSAAPQDAHPGRTTAQLMPEMGPLLDPILARVLRTGTPESDVILAARVPGHPHARRRYGITCYPLRPKGRPPMGVGVMVMDLAERDLLEEQLRHSQKMEAVGRLAGGIAHDFNNVLTIIQSYSELLALEGKHDDAGKAEIHAIRAAADRAKALAGQLLAFTRREIVVPRVLDVNLVIREMEQMLRRLLKQGVELDLALADAALLVRGDGHQIEQVLMNLAINAIDAMPAGGRLTISSHVLTEMPALDGAPAVPGVLVRVRDTGTGMSPEIQAMLFEPFFTTKPEGRGTGLGLATTYAIVRQMNGQIRVRSAEGEGSTFEVILPRRSPEEMEPEMRASPARGMAALSGGEVVLLAEDEPAIRSALARMLRSGGYRVIEASNGGEALRLAEEEPGVIDLVLTDIMMPGVGGKELVQRLLVQRPGTRVILMSGYTDDEGLRRELGDSRYHFLQKPFAARAAVQAVRDALDAP